MPFTLSTSFTSRSKSTQASSPKHITHTHKHHKSHKGTLKPKDTEIKQTQIDGNQKKRTSYPSICRPLTLTLSLSPLPLPPSKKGLPLGKEKKNNNNKKASSTELLYPPKQIPSNITNIQKHRAIRFNGLEQLCPAFVNNESTLCYP